MTTQITLPNADQTINPPPVRRRTLVATAALSAALAAGATFAIINPGITQPDQGVSSAASDLVVPDATSANTEPGLDFRPTSAASGSMGNDDDRGSCFDFASAEDVARIPH